MKRRNSRISIFIFLLTVVALSANAETGIQFVDVTQEAGIYWKHTDGRSGEKYFMETLGSGAVFLTTTLMATPICTSLTAHRSPATSRKSPQPIASTAITVMAPLRMSLKMLVLGIPVTDTDALWATTIMTVN